MRVVMLVTDLERGGTPLRLARLACGLHNAGIEIFVGCLASPGPVSQMLEADGIHTFACNANGPKDYKAILRLNDIIRKIHPQLIHATLTHANVAARIVGILRGIPVLTSTATIEVERGWHRHIERLTAPWDRGHIVNSPALGRHVVRNFRVPRSRVHFIAPTIDAPPKPTDRKAAREALGIADHEFAVLWVGRIDPVKRVDVIVNCAEIMSRQPTQFFVVGDGPHRGAIDQLMRVSSAGRTLRMMGWLEDRSQVMTAADAFMLPSLTEGMPNALLEAMAFGLPCIAADLPTLRDIAGHNERLMLVRDDEPQGYVEAIEYLRDNPECREQLAQAGQNWAKQFIDVEPAIKQLIAAYEEALTNK